MKSAGGHHLLGLCYEKLSKIREAQAEFEKSLFLDPGNRLYRLALDHLSDFGAEFGDLIARSKSKLVDQIAVDENALLVENDPNTHLRLGVLYHLLDKLDLAVEHYGEALRLNPNLFAAHYLLATAYEGLSNPKLAIAEYKNYLSRAVAGPYVQSCYHRLGVLQADSDNSATSGNRH